MAYNYDDEVIEACGAMKVRPESPALEIEAGRAIERAFRELVQNKYLYQNQEVDLKPILEPLKEVIKQASIQHSTPGAGSSGPPMGPKPVEVTPERFAALCKEVATRPWILATRHKGDSDMDRRVSKVAGIGSVNSSAGVEDMQMGFLLPSVQLQCLGACKTEKTFSGYFKSRGNPYSQPWGMVKAADTEQLFFPIFRCEGCSQFAYTMLVKRKGLKLQLCGVSPRRPAKVNDKIPEALRPILRDAEQSVAEADLFAAFYHLRTLIEHYVKGRLSLPMKEKKNGDDLIAQYNSTIIEGLRGTLPSMLTSWQFLSEALHAREGKPEDFSKHRDAVCQHIEVIALLGEKALVQPAAA